MQYLTRLFLVSLLAILVSCTDTESTNPFPKDHYRFIKVSGKTFPKLDMKFHVTKTATIESRDCTFYSLGEGERKARNKGITLNTVRPNGTYKVKIPVNKKPEGECGWEVHDIIYLNGVSLLHLSDDKRGTFSLISMNCSVGISDSIHCQESQAVREKARKFSDDGIAVPEVHESAKTVTVNFTFSE